MIQFLPKTLQRISEINTVNHFDQSSKWGKREGGQYMSSQIPCKDLDRENTNLIDEEVHLMADLNSAGDRTDLGIPGMRKFSVISC